MPAGGGDARFGLIDTVVNIDHLRPYKRRPPQLGSSEEGDQPDALVIVPRGGTWREVEDVMVHRHQRHGRRFFLWEVASGQLGHTLAAPRTAEKLRGATGSRKDAHGSVSGVDSRWGGNLRHSYLGGVLVGNGPRRGYWRARVVPGGETGVFVGFSLHVCGNGLWESTSVCSPGFP